MLRLKKQNRNALIVWALILLTSFLMMSCGARKSESTKTKESIKSEFTDKSKLEQAEQIQTNSETNVKKTEVVTVDDQNQTTTTKEILEPIDPTKLASYVDENGKKQELNNSKKTVETTTQKNNTKTEAQAKTEALGKTESQTNKNASENKDIRIKSDVKKLNEAKSVDRKAWSYWNLFWVLVPIGIGYLAWKNKTKIADWVSGLWWV